MAETRTRRLGSLFKIKHGYAFKGEYFADEGPYIVTTPGNFHDQGGFKPKSGAEKFYTGPVPEGYLLSAGDLLVAMTEQKQGLLGSSALIPESGKYLHNQRLGLVTDLQEDQLDKVFLYYLFNTSIVRDQIQASANGTKVRHTSPTRISEVDVVIPPLPTQRRIASILSTYDDLIENNTRRIEILEEMARRIYEEWFVHFRFPGHEDAKFVETEQGRIPEGWQPAALASFGEIITGKTPSKKDSSNYGEDVPFLKLPDMHGNIFVLDTAERLSFKGADSQGNKYIPAGSISVSCIGTVGVVVVTSRLCHTNQQINTIVPSDPIYREFLFYAVRSLKETMNLYGSNGATMTNLNKAKFASLQVVKPVKEWVERYNLTVSPMFDMILSLQKKMVNLREQRDLLLPQLVSGQIDVSDAENMLEDVA